MPDKFISLSHSMIRRKDLTMQEKIVYLEILNLSSLEKGCIATNRHFEVSFGISKKSVSNTISSLVAKGFITSKLSDRNNTRVLSIKDGGVSIKDGGVSIKDGGVSIKDGGVSIKDGESKENIQVNIQVNNKKINKKENQPHQTSSNTKNFNKEKYRIFDEEDFLPRSDIETIEVEVEVVELKEKPLEEKAIDYLNKLIGKNFSYTNGNTKEIKAQIKKGATEEQLKYVIDVKCNEWLNNAEMKKHLNPTTLFREANFNKYLNQDFDISGVVMDEYIRQRCEEVQNANK